MENPTKENILSPETDVSADLEDLGDSELLSRKQVNRQQVCGVCEQQFIVELSHVSSGCKQRQGLSTSGHSARNTPWYEMLYYIIFKVLEG